MAALETPELLELKTRLVALLYLYYETLWACFHFLAALLATLPWWGAILFAIIFLWILCCDAVTAYEFWAESWDLGSRRLRRSKELILRPVRAARVWLTQQLRRPPPE